MVSENCARGPGGGAQGASGEAVPFPHSEALQPCIVVCHLILDTPSCGTLGNELALSWETVIITDIASGHAKEGRLT